MYIENINGMTVLNANFGYILHNKKSDTYSYRVYLGKYTSLDNFEEVDDNTVSTHLKRNVIRLEEKNKSLNKIGKIVANQVTDDVLALEIQEFYDIWEVDVKYPVGRYITYDDILYKVLIEHTSQKDWTPDITTSLYAKVLVDPSGETINEWVQPDSTNAYMKGDKVRYEGSVYVSLIDNNIWSPTTYPAGWEKVEE